MKEHIVVIMPAYNAERWIGESIDSVRAQTLTDWELIVVDDGSTDGTAQVVRGYADPRVRLVCEENSGGPARPRNIGIRNARGRYVSLLDADGGTVPPGGVFMPGISGGNLFIEIDLAYENSDFSLVQNPTPEPGAAVLLILGGFGILVRHRRRRLR